MVLIFTKLFFTFWRHGKISDLLINWDLFARCDCGNGCGVLKCANQGIAPLMHINSRPCASF